ncbi:hypothetical protein FGE12_15605 [Aggregicoccus sp. 17bor-14]|uniref:hypothetical protein n=1 Tax=Myxococcaceae TaxID=31 RepID=UPI00129D0ACF|nr:MULTISPECIES: hypothetical protein [Myxococcaceae]MBF5043825.1 hypothetical protein [Simulacricoccus sp. 17bor-14]MRI89577.1 hypothetical protein [Aggregicoccus sp. 17bor-14]
MSPCATPALSRLLPLATCVLLACGGGSGDTGDASTLKGTWRGTVSGLVVEARIDSEQGSSFGGILTLSDPRCFNSGRLLGGLADTSVTMTASGSGSTSEMTVVAITGQVSGDVLAGYFSATPQATGAASPCKIDRAPLTMTRQ